MLKISLICRQLRPTWSASLVRDWPTSRSGKGASWNTRWATWPALLEACLHSGPTTLPQAWPSTTFSSGLKLPELVMNLTIAPVSTCDSLVSLYSHRLLFCSVRNIVPAVIKRISSLMKLEARDEYFKGIYIFYFKKHWFSTWKYLPLVYQRTTAEVIPG